MGQPQWVPDGSFVNIDKRPSVHNEGTVTLKGEREVVDVDVTGVKFIHFDSPVKLRLMEIT